MNRISLLYMATRPGFRDVYEPIQIYRIQLDPNGQD